MQRPGTPQTGKPRPAWRKETTMAIKKVILKPCLARIVADSRDATRDRFISQAEAAELYAKGLLRSIDCGEAYTPSYEWVRK